MTKIELFVEKLGKSISEQDLNCLNNPPKGMGKEDYDYYKATIVGTYFPKRQNSELVLFDDLILDFIYNYDVKYFDLFSVHLNDYNDVSSDEKYIFFGTYEGAELVIEKESEFILQIDTDGYVIGKCSGKSSVFLNNLVELDKFMNVKRTLVEKEEFIKENLGISKNSETYNFWLTLIGEWDDDVLNE